MSLEYGTQYHPGFQMKRKKPFTARVEEKLLTRVKLLGVRRDVTLESLVDEAFRLLLASRAETIK